MPEWTSAPRGQRPARLRGRPARPRRLRGLRRLRAAAARASTAWTPTTLIAELGGAALRGRGGAGFPTGRKASFLAPGAERYLVVNADESEPGTFKDRELLLRTPHALLEGILIVMNVLRLTRAYIYIRGEYLTESEVLEAAIAEARERGYVGRAVGADGYAPEITVHRGAGAYICGEETALLVVAQRLPRPAERQAAVPGRLGRVRAARRCSTTSRRSRRSRRSCAWAPRRTTSSAPSRAAART